MNSFLFAIVTAIVLSMFASSIVACTTQQTMRPMPGLQLPATTFPELSGSWLDHSCIYGVLSPRCDLNRSGVLTPSHP